MLYRTSSVIHISSVEPPLGANLWNTYCESGLTVHELTIAELTPSAPPTPAPTFTTLLQIVPSKLAVTARKPDVVESEFFMVNANPETLSFAVRLNYSLLPNFADLTITPPRRGAAAPRRAEAAPRPDPLGVPLPGLISRASVPMTCLNHKSSKSASCSAIHIS